jgi:hypothetical protein
VASAFSGLSAGVGVVVLDPASDQSENGLGIWQRRHLDVVALQRFHESLRDAVALRALDRREAGLGEFAPIAELAEREGIAPSYMTRILRLTLLSPDIVETILDGKQGPEVTLTQVLEPFPVEWTAQRGHFSLTT